MEKNRDTMFQDLKRLLFHSRNSITSGMWPDGAQDITKTTKRPVTAGTIFKNSMIALIKNLSSKEPYYVRTLKPNVNFSLKEFFNLHKIFNSKMCLIFLGYEIPCSIR